MLSTSYMLTGCKSNEEKANDFLRKCARNAIADYESYEPLQTELDSIVGIASFDPQVQSYAEEIQALINNSMDIYRKFRSSGTTEKIDSLNKTIADIRVIANKIREIDAQNKQKLVGWSVIHRYRYKDNGIPKIDGVVLFISPNFDEIINLPSEDSGKLIDASIKGVFDKNIEQIDFNYYSNRADSVAIVDIDLADYTDYIN